MGPMPLNRPQVMRYAASLQRALSLTELTRVAWEAVVTETRYRHLWFGIFEDGEQFMRFLDVKGSEAEAVLETCPRVPVAGDEMAKEIVSGRAPVIVIDGLTDPRTNKEIVSVLRNRTIINIPLVLGPVLLGTLGVGSYGDEGTLPPLPEELDFLVLLSVQLSSAFSRLQLLDQQQRESAERARLERHLEALQRVELMGVLASGVAHDLNNLMTIVTANLACLSAQNEDEREALDEVKLATTKAVEVSRQLLTLGRKSAPRVLVNLGQRVEAACRLIQSSLSRDVTLRPEVRASFEVEADPVQLDQLLANLLINARDAVGQTGVIDVEVDVRALTPQFVSQHTWAREGTFGHVQIRDSGCGMPPEVLERMFDPLFTTKARGTGLGLAVVSRVVEQHRGLIHCISAPSKGTTFDVFLPSPAR